jgi:hypothetical protein
MKKRWSIIVVFLAFIFCIAFASADANPETMENLLPLWQENGIELNDLKPSYSCQPDNDQDYYLYVYKIDSDYRITYRLHSDKEVIFIDVPWEYQPKEDMYALTISYFMNIPILEAKQIYDSLSYNMINSLSERDYDDINIVLSEIDTPSLMITRTFAN